ncbi:RagB/SusD family nutrient uptake outer membrane protein [Elizabethkingia bruuniana]|uniref:RagB/SusD family nutrient uptake outer membrane protein n=2 Tax=Elizabethkingia bruuniana TaxID=1756149 RepID=A0A7T7V3H4_9FLAO|nr:glycan metabolism protein [Elizabethkingia bruuniana]KUY24970.1 glycan metabolism protein [Elizabethkingia bruuniana]OPB62023.1 glycan metabolism protein [Elizabethkingia bruuniana]QDZ64746.1 RagB/SusD family nutrient uptake outer membrane protein [Elizabethkingia bruuniana]QQN61064.1 RagB/SusD family nutrient uptake outer membrane protein [Elizabethkingia bruuniana]
MLFACLGISMVSCNNMLDVDPQDALDTERVYSSVSNFEKGVLGSYSLYSPEYSVLIGSIMADESRLNPQNNGVNGFGNLLNRWEYTSEDDILLKAWKNYYADIYSINLLLENAAKVPVRNEQERSKQKSLIAELYGLRAMVHFELHRNFGTPDADGNEALTIPYITDTDVNKKPGKISLSKFYEYVWLDLERAKDIDETVDFRMNKNAVTALEARVALYQKNYIVALAKSTQLINQFQLSDINQYENLWKDKSPSEVIFRLKRSNDNKLRPNTLWQDYAAGRKFFQPSYKLMNSYTESDIRLSNFSKDGDMEEEFINKYPGNDFSDKVNDIKVFRVSEMYLIRAEANYFLNRKDASLQDINELRKHRISNGGQLNAIDLNTILNERYLELSYEGHRYYDLKRLKLPVQRLEKDLAAEGDQKELNSNDKAYILPIPLKETIVNPNLK